MSRPREARAPHRRSTLALFVVGTGLGALFDGIVFHQILQWHHMLSSANPPTTLANLEMNTLADGLFHAGGWIATLAGIALLVRAAHFERDPKPAFVARAVAGALIAGWGAFNVIEGIVDHYLLQVHHVRPGPDQGLYDAAFLAWGAAFAVLGYWLIRTSTRSAGRL